MSHACTGYIPCWDNIQVSAHRKHKGPTRRRRINFDLMALCFAVRHRTPVLEDDGPRVEAQELDGQGRCRFMRPDGHHRAADPGPPLT